MKRREFLAGLGALGVFGAGAATAIGPFDPTEAFESGAAGDEATAIAPHDLPRIDAPGSPPGTEMVPEKGRVTYLTFFATWCSICSRKMEPLGVAYDAVGDGVQFVSVTNEPVGKTITAEDVVEWWRNHDGRWPVAHDEGLALTMAVDAPGVPYSLVFDADNRLTWSDSGYKSADEIRERIRAATSQ